VATAILAPVALLFPVAGGVPAAALPFVAATTLLHALYFYALGRSYRSGAFSLVYPVARGLGVALVPVLALVLFDERLSGFGAAGVALVVAGIVALHLARRAAARPPGTSPTAGGTGWALLTGLTIAAYSLVDRAGVTRLHPIRYIVLLGLGSSLLLLPMVVARPGELRGEWSRNRRRILLASTMSLTAYLLVLFAFRISKTGYVVAARELSIVLSAVIGSRWLGEGRLAPLLAGAGAVLAGVACIALA
jgi:multidrug transporter EmrE-like cation transporter